MEEQVLLGTHNALWQGPEGASERPPSTRSAAEAGARLRRSIHHQMSGQVAYPARPRENEKMHLPSRISFPVMCLRSSYFFLDSLYSVICSFSLPSFLDYFCF